MSVSSPAVFQDYGWVLPLEHQKNALQTQFWAFFPHRKNKIDVIFRFSSTPPATKFRISPPKSTKIQQNSDGSLQNLGEYRRVKKGGVTRRNSGDWWEVDKKFKKIRKIVYKQIMEVSVGSKGWKVKWHAGSYSHRISFIFSVFRCYFTRKSCWKSGCWLRVW